MNERDNISRLLDDIYKAVPDVHEIVVVDDDSVDGTAHEVQAYSAAHAERRIRVELRTTDHGLTKSIAHGVGVATGDVVVWMDCDLSMPANVIPKLLRGVEEGYDAAIGSRFVRGGSFKRDTAGTPDSALAVALSRLMNYGIQLLLDHRLKDYTSGFIAARRTMLLDLGFRGDYGEYFIDLMFRAVRAGYLVLEVPYICLPRLHGTSKTGTSLIQYLSRGRGYVATALGLRLAALGRGARPERAFPAAQRSIVDAETEVRPMQEDDVPLVAGLHHRLLFDTLNSRLGIPFLERLYGGLLEDPAARCWIGLSEGRHVAFVSATADLHATDQRIVRGVPFRERLVAALHILAAPRDLRSYLAHQALLLYTRWRFGKPYPTILTLGVSESMWGTGLAQRLIERVDAHFKSAGTRRFFVDATANNNRAVGFYEKTDFERVGHVFGNLIFCRDSSR